MSAKVLCGRSCPDPGTRPSEAEFERYGEDIAAAAYLSEAQNPMLWNQTIAEAAERLSKLPGPGQEKITETELRNVTSFAVSDTVLAGLFSAARNCLPPADIDLSDNAGSQR